MEQSVNKESLNLAIQFYQTGNFEEAGKIYKKLLEIESEKIEIHNFMGCSSGSDW